MGVKQPEPEWLSMFDMPIGDHRNLVLEVRGADGVTATARWSGDAWVYAYGEQRGQALPFKPVQHRLLTEATKQPAREEIACVERVMRMAGPTATIEVQPSRIAQSGELWTLHIRRAGVLGIGQGGSLEEAFADLRAASADAKAA